MNLQDRIRSFAWLSSVLSNFPDAGDGETDLKLSPAVNQAVLDNLWFTSGNIATAVNNLGKMMAGEQLEEWVKRYPRLADHEWKPKTVCVIMAGNIPLVGFHDFLCVLLSGHRILARLSAEDARLLPAIAGLLIGYNTEWLDMIDFASGTVDNFDAVVATGNNNTSRYFNYYFGKYPNIIRNNRNSAAILDGYESDEELELIAGDIMLFFGMGCRSISKIYVPVGYHFERLINALSRFSAYSDHNKYRNNYDYQRSVFMLNQIPAIDTGCLLLTENSSLISPISVVNFSYYTEFKDVVAEIKSIPGEIQCVVSRNPLETETVKPGEAQRPQLWDYADQVDTMKFLLDLYQ